MRKHNYANELGHYVTLRFTKFQLFTALICRITHEDLDIINSEDRRNEVYEFWIPSLFAGISRAGFRSFCNLVDMPASRAYPASSCILPGSTFAIAVQSVLFQAR